MGPTILSSDKTCTCVEPPAQVDDFQVVLNPQLNINEMFSAAPDYKGEEECEPDDPQQRKEEGEEERGRRGSGQEGEESSNGKMNIGPGTCTFLTRACQGGQRAFSP